MERTPYRRITPSRHSGGTHEREHDTGRGETVSNGETLIMQCIICGIIMVFVLIASMTDIAPAATLRSGITQVLSGAETLDELITDIRQFGSDWLDLDIAPPTTVIPDEFNIPAINFPYYENTITDHLPPAADNQVSNLTVPEPPVTPGLWD